VATIAVKNCSGFGNDTRINTASRSDSDQSSYKQHSAGGNGNGNAIARLGNNNRIVAQLHSSYKQ